MTSGHEFTCEGTKGTPMNDVGIWRANARGKKLPLIVFAHDAGEGCDKTKDKYHTFLGDMASKGYVVIAPLSNCESHVRCLTFSTDLTTSMDWIFNDNKYGTMIDTAHFKIGVVGVGYHAYSTWEYAHSLALSKTYNLGAYVNLYPERLYSKNDIPNAPSFMISATGDDAIAGAFSTL